MSDHPLSRLAVGRLSAAMLVLGGLVGFSLPVLTGAEGMLSGTGVAAVGGASVLLGAVVWRCPWSRWPPRCSLVLPAVTLVMAGLHNYYAGAEPYRYAIFFLTIFAWIGLTQRRWTSLWFVPPFAVAYVTPLCLLGREAGAVQAAAFTASISVLTAEVLAWVSARLGEAQRALGRSEERFRSLVQHASDAIVVFAVEGAVLYASPSIERFLGRPAESLLGQRLRDFVHEEDLGALRQGVLRVIATPRSTTGFEYRVRRADGGLLWVEASVSNLLDDPSVGGIVANCRDVTERKALQERLTRLAFHDHLTGLPNRASFADRLATALARAAQDGSLVAVLFVDLDRFKAVNDTFGHAVGDRLLVAAAERLQASLRAGDSVARLGGDEFTALLAVEDEGEAVRLAERIANRLRAPFLIDGLTASVGCSIGVAVADGSAEAADVLRRADRAMYSAKTTSDGIGSLLLAPAAEAS